MARQIIILEDTNPGRSGTEPIAYRYAFWLNVPAARQSFYANASATSQVAGISSTELTAIQSGAIKEVVDSFSAPAGTTLAQIQSGLVVLFSAANNALASSANNKWDHYGSSYDPSAGNWTIVTVG